jgi:hypothetical protein
MVLGRNQAWELGGKAVDWTLSAPQVRGVGKLGNEILELGSALLLHLHGNSDTLVQELGDLFKVASIMVRVVRAGVYGHHRGVMADRSPGTQFLFKVIDTASHTFSNLLPVKPMGLRSQRTKVVLVPPSHGISVGLELVAKAAAFFLTC